MAALEHRQHAGYCTSLDAYAFTFGICYLHMKAAGIRPRVLHAYFSGSPPGRGPAYKRQDLQCSGLEHYALRQRSLVQYLQEDLVNRLRSFYNRCVRSTRRITMAHTIKHRITSKRLFERLGVGSFYSYYNRRLLRFPGHVARIPPDRMPRKLLTGWIEHFWPVVYAQMTWVHTLKKALKSTDLSTDFEQ